MARTIRTSEEHRHHLLNRREEIMPRDIGDDLDEIALMEELELERKQSEQKQNEGGAKCES